MNPTPRGRRSSDEEAASSAPPERTTLTRRELLLGGGLAAACPAPISAQPAARSVVVATVSSGYQEGLEQLAREYEALVPGVRVKIQIMPVNGYETWLRTQIPAGGANAPDLFNANYAWGLYERGLMVNLSPYLDAHNPHTGLPWIRTLNAQFLERFKTGGDVSFIPLDFIEIGFYYNADLFLRMGLREPKTWEEMLATAARIQQAGIIPFAVPGNADSYWSGTVGWIARFFSDAYTRPWVPLVMARPGDWNYDAKRNGHFHLDLKDPYNDAYVVLNTERILAAVRDRVIGVNNGRFAEAYTRIRQFARYWQRGFDGASSQTAYNLFLTGRAAILLETSALISQLLRDMADLPARYRFRWSIFPVPPMTMSAYHIPPFRGVGGPGTVFGVVKKDAAQVRLVVDFLMFLTTPRAARILVDQAYRHHKPLNGPMLIPGAKLPEELAHYFRPFQNRGFEKLSFRGLLDEQQSIWEWTVWAQRYMEDLISLPEFLRRYERTLLQAVPRIIAMQHLDMNPRTKDLQP